MACEELFFYYSVAALQDELHIQSHVRPLMGGRNVFPVQGNVHAAISGRLPHIFQFPFVCCADGLELNCRLVSITCDWGTTCCEDKGLCSYLFFTENPFL